MTIAIEQPETEQGASGTTRPAPSRHENNNAVRRIVAFALGALLAIAVGFVLFQVFEGPLAHEWYTLRQHQLASQFKSARPHTGAGAAVAVMQVPRLGLNLVVIEGASPQRLRSGPAHVSGTPMPGDVGNSVIVGHNRAWGGPLHSASGLHATDYIVVATQPANALPQYGVFKVVSVRTTGANDRSITAPATDRRLTIVTGAGGEYSGKQLVITAVSGDVRRVNTAVRSPELISSAGSPLWNGDLLVAVGAIACAVLVYLVMRRRYHRFAIAAAVTPLVVLAAFVMVLDLDLALGAVR